ncbi:ATP-grasp domain-containing protein [Micromonospora sp. NPDC001898]|uniref:ATP-grasp domain-containing protein n=1 Tax=Micromonospora sp. NPDC001898 TaxID=3364221 RepID=UPI0036823304
MSSPDDRRALVLVGYVQGWLPLLRRTVGDLRVIIIEEPAVAYARGARAHLAAHWPECDLYELDFRRPMAADLFHVWHPDLRIQAVVPVDDAGVVFAARLAQRLGLPGAGPASAEILGDKFLLRQVAEAGGVAGPQWRLIRSPADAVAFAERVPGGLVLKPTARAGSSGVQIVPDAADVPAGWERMVAPPAHSSTRFPAVESYLAERRMVGRQYNVNLLVRRGEVLFRNVTATEVAPGAHPVPVTETIDPDLPPAQYAQLVAEAERLVAAVDFDTGFIHSEWILEDGVVRLVECAGRLAGGPIMMMIGYAYSYDIVAAYLAVMSGEPLDVALPAQPRSASMLLTKHVRPGLVTAITGVEAARDRDGVLALDVLVTVGDQVGELVSLPSVAARVVTLDRTVAEARRAGEDALAVLDVSTVPSAVEDGRAGSTA